MKLIVYLLFLLSVAFASAGIVLSIRLRSRIKTDGFSSMMFLQAFVYTFGFYGIWGQIFIRNFLSGFVSADAIVKFSNISLLLGMPFIVLAWMMLLKFSIEISGRKTRIWFIILFLAINLMLVLGIGYIDSGSSLSLTGNMERIYYIILNIFYSVSASVIILMQPGKSSFLSRHDNGIIAFMTVALSLLQAVSLYYYNVEPWAGMAFIFLFFAGNSFLPVYLSYGTEDTSAQGESYHDQITASLTFEEFCKKYDISPRESDIVKEICNGLSNKEISDRLFISLQTVKDHTHRIYIKTNVKSRLQLMNLAKDCFKS